MPHSLDELEKLQAVKYREICEFIANDIGIELGGRSSPEARASVRRAADEAIENWDKAFVDSDRGSIAAVTPLQKLLAEHHAISEQILVLLDKEIFGDDDL